jgi:fructose-bisphosphate aldolase, class I
MIERIQELLGNDADTLLNHTSTTIPKESLHLPGPDFLDRVFVPSDRNIRVLHNLAWIYRACGGCIVRAQP